MKVYMKLVMIIRVRLANVATSKNLTGKSAMFPRCNIDKNTLMPLDWKTHNQIDHILIDR
jgi:hypothetical protein